MYKKYYKEKPFADGENRYSEKYGFIIENRAYPEYDDAVRAYIRLYRVGTEEAIRAITRMANDYIKANMAAGAEGGAK